VSDTNPVPDTSGDNETVVVQEAEWGAVLLLELLGEREADIEVLKTPVRDDVADDKNVSDTDDVLVADSDTLLVMTGELVYECERDDCKVVVELCERETVKVSLEVRDCEPEPDPVII